MIAGISASGSLQGLYPQYNKRKVSKVKRIHKDETSFSEAKETSTQDTTPMESTIFSDYQATLADEVEGEEMISYDTSNPYMCSKKSIDASLLLGINFDERI